jgi:hypothetical protein
MILYNVTVNIDHEVEKDWLQWMKDVHIPEVMATGLFVENRMYKVLSEDDGGTTYAIQYACATMAHYERYREEHAQRLQAETQKYYGGRFVAFRTLLEVVHPL